MTDGSQKEHHPLPGDERARHDLLPESAEGVRTKGDDAPQDPKAERRGL